MFNKLLLILSFYIVSLELANAQGVGSAIAPPTYVGEISVTGNMGYTTENYKGVWLAHYKCKETFENSRAALYDDIKYIYKDLSGTNYYWILDPYIYATDDGAGTYKAFLKNGQTITDSNNNCDGWVSASASYTGLTLLKTNPQFTLEDCSVARKIPCVVE